jgi:SsrA-binding protein
METTNKKARYNYELLDFYICGIVLFGTEVKSLRKGEASFTDAFCFIDNNEMILRGLHISEYKEGTYQNHEPKRDRKLLLTRKEIDKLQIQIEQKGRTIVPTKIFFNEQGWAKVEIALATGKKTYDKRETIKERDIDRDIQRELNN